MVHGHQYLRVKLWQIGLFIRRSFMVVGSVKNIWWRAFFPSYPTRPNSIIMEQLNHKVIQVTNIIDSKTSWRRAPLLLWFSLPHSNFLVLSRHQFCLQSSLGLMSPCYRYWQARAGAVLLVVAAAVEAVLWTRSGASSRRHFCGIPRYPVLRELPLPRFILCIQALALSPSPWFAHGQPPFTVLSGYSWWRREDWWLVLDVDKTHGWAEITRTPMDEGIPYHRHTVAMECQTRRHISFFYIYLLGYILMI
jgi:hypothetical protein